jgi:uncharacterized membrane protein YqjE
VVSEAQDASTSSTDPSIGDLVRDASTHLSTLVRGEIELAKLEVADSVKRLGWGSAFFGAAGAVLFFSLFFPFIALAEGLVAVGLPRWAAYLVAWAVMLVLSALLAVVGIRFVKRVRKPERTLETVRDTAAWVRHPTRGGGTATGGTSTADTADTAAPGTGGTPAH